MLRKAKESDINSVEKLIKNMTKYGKVLTRPKSEIKNSIKSFYIWEEKGKIIGCCSLKIYSKKIGELRSLIVLPKYQKKGIGSKLVEACINEAKSNGIYEILAITDRDRFFGRLGFKKSVDNKWPMFIKL